jgi:hypothetical protein
MARSYVTYARLLETWERNDEARRYLTDALEMFRQMGMARELANAQPDHSNGPR